MGEERRTTSRQAVKAGRTLTSGEESRSRRGTAVPPEERSTDELRVNTSSKPKMRCSGKKGQAGPGRARNDSSGRCRLPYGWSTRCPIRRGGNEDAQGRRGARSDLGHFEPTGAAGVQRYPVEARQGGHPAKISISRLFQPMAASYLCSVCRPSVCPFLSVCLPASSLASSPMCVCVCACVSFLFSFQAFGGWVWPSPLALPLPLGPSRMSILWCLVP